MTEIININRDRNRVRAGMRWFGPEDSVSIKVISQTPGVTNIISALHHIPAGDIWTEDDVAQRKIEVEFERHSDTPSGLTGLALYEWYQSNGVSTGLCWDTAESLVFTEEIKNGRPARNKHIENYKESLINLGKFGVNNVIGNFMLMADWTRTDLVKHEDGSTALHYDHAKFTAFDIFMLKRHGTEQAYIDDGSYTTEEIAAARTLWDSSLKNDAPAKQALQDMIIAGLPGAQQGFDLDEFRAGVAKYKDMSVADLRAHIAYFLKAVMPTAKEAGIRLCSHPDDPAFSPFLGTPRAVGNAEGYKFLLDHGCGVNLCPGSLMAAEENRDIARLIRTLAAHGLSRGMSIDEIFPHVHLRPIITNGKNFTEGHHAENREELAQIVHALVDIGWQGVFRPDHALAPDHGFGRPGYDAIGRGYGANLLLGLFAMAEMYKRIETTQDRTAALALSPYRQSEK